MFHSLKELETNLEQFNFGLLKIASDFEERWNMPHCVGAIDGKRVVIECPSKSGSEDYNCKYCFNKSLLAIAVPATGLHPFLSACTDKEQLQGDQGDSALTSHFAEAHSEIIFNYHLSRARRVIENAFGIMAQKWRILRLPLKAKDDNARRIISACVVLHNFLFKESPTSRSAYYPPGTADHLDWQENITEGSWMAEDSSNSSLPPLRSPGCHSTS
ncbi:hypothetical protein HPB49_024981 [Dermacentor silvarum]|uniref:Uncharacterized protein n=1 Tax=Dermacentor silvarum TaxID=543639 RepID=A0ACB8CC69_DERSI|nr:hypothetical protein HPB49_024981 [Dermacentor silvarum]